MEGVPELISRVRDHYLHQFLGFVEMQHKQWPSGHAEVKFELSDQSKLFRRLYCVDFVAKENDGAIVREMYPDRILTFEPLSFEVHGIPVIIERLVWDDVQLDHDAGTLASAALDRWFNYWFDTDDAWLDPASDIAGVVHSLFIEAGRLEIDFGTAATEAFWDILDVLATAGAANIRVTSGREPE